MKLRNICFVIVPLIFFGCGAYHYMHRPEEGTNAKKIPENSVEKQNKINQLNGRKR